MCCFSSTHLRVKTGEVLSSSFSHPRTVIARSTLQNTNGIRYIVEEGGRGEGEEVEKGGRKEVKEEGPANGEEAGRRKLTERQHCHHR